MLLTRTMKLISKERQIVCIKEDSRLTMRNSAELNLGSESRVGVEVTRISRLYPEPKSYVTFTDY